MIAVAYRENSAVKLKRYTMKIWIVLCLTAWVGSTQAQVIAEETINVAVTGKITAVSATAKTITVKGANEDGGIFVVNDKTTIMSDGPEQLDFSALKVGQHAAVDANTKDGKQVATYIEIVDAAK